MGIFDFLKPKRGVDENTFNSEQFRIEALAFASWKLQENNNDYSKAKAALNEIGLNEEQKGIIIATLKSYNITSELVPQLQVLISNKENQKAFDLAYDEYLKNKDNVQLLEIVMQVYQTYNDEDKTLELFDKLIEINPFEKQNIEYRKGLLLKSIKRFDNAKNEFQKLIEIREFAWDYYQIAIIENLQGNTDAALEYLRKTFAIDPDLKEDAKTFPELENLRTNPEFMKLLY